MVDYITGSIQQQGRLHWVRPTVRCKGSGLASTSGGWSPNIRLYNVLLSEVAQGGLIGCWKWAMCVAATAVREATAIVVE